MSSKANGIPDDCVKHPDVEWITVKVPVFTGPVEVRYLGGLDKFNFSVCQGESAEGIIRLHEGYKLVYPSPARETSKALVARWLFGHIAKAFSPPAP